MSTRREAEERLDTHRAQCETCQAGQSCRELARLEREWDRQWRAQIDSLTTGGLR